MPSERYSLNRDDIDRWGRNAAIFFAPALLVFLLSIRSGGSFADSLAVVDLWFLNTVIDLVRKFIADNKA